MGARGCRAPLALVAGADALAAVGPLARAGQPEQAQLPDLHPRPQRDRQVGDVRQLQRDVAAEPGVDEARRRVGEQAEAAERALAFQPSGEVVGQRDGLERRTEHELTRMEHEGVVAVRLDRSSELVLLLPRVDVGVAGVLEHPEVAVEPHVDAGGLQHGGVPWFEHQPAVGQLLGEVAVREEHGATLRLPLRRVGNLRRIVLGEPRVRQLEQGRCGEAEHPRHGLLDADGLQPVGRLGRRLVRREQLADGAHHARAEDAADGIARLGDEGPVDEHGGRAEARRVADQLGVVGDEHGADAQQGHEIGERHVADDGAARVARDRGRGTVGAQLAEEHDLDVRLAVEQLGEPGEDAQRIEPVERHQHDARPLGPHSAEQAGEPQVSGLRVGRHRVADGDRVGPDRAAERGAAGGEEQGGELADDPPVGLLRERAEQVVARHPRLQVDDRDLPPERDLRRDRGGHPAAVNHDRRRVEVDQQLVEARHEHRADRGRVDGVERIAQQLGDVGGHPECLERLVDGHRVGPGRHRDRPDAVDVVERRRHRREPGDLRSTACNQEDVVIVILVRERPQGWVVLRHAGVPHSRGSWPYGAPEV